MQMDPLADIAENYSPYNYSNNNPINFNDPSGLQDEPSKGFTLNNRIIKEEVVVYPDNYRKKIHDHFNSLDRNGWESLIGKYTNKGMDYTQIRNHFSGLSSGAQYMMEKGIYFDDFNHTRIKSGRAGDKVFLNVMCTLIPVGRIVKWGGTGIKFLANAYNKPIVKQIVNNTTQNFGKETIKEFFAADGNVGDMDRFDIYSGVVTSNLKLGKAGDFFKNVVVETANAAIDIKGNGGISIVGVNKDFQKAGWDFMWGQGKNINILMISEFGGKGFQQEIADIFTDQIKLVAPEPK